VAKIERPFSASPEGDAAAGEAPSGKARRTTDKRERILRGAIEVFARKGFYATRVSEIAKAAGVADGTIYLYFKNKDDVLICIFEDRITKLLAFLRGELEKVSSVEDRLRLIVELQLGLLEGQRDLAEVITVNLRQSSRLLKQYAAPLFTEYLDLIAGVVAEGQRDGLLRDDVSPRVVARGLWGALDGVALTWALGGARAGKPETLRRAASQIASVFLEGLRVQRT
jgi:TetR/AcrR family fatty acid metabolism transcriptional regulator